MMQIDSVIQHAEQHCKQRGVRLTTKRKQVLSALVQSNKALSAYELIEHCKELFDQSIPAMSVYRILEFLETEHLVHKLSLANKYVACAHICCSHGHGVPQFLICGKCNKVKEITIAASTIDELKQNAQQAGFTLVSQQLEMNCVCDDCLNQAA
ncbi:Fur family transcriptional regulator [Agarivorans sp. Alg241-V36]|jgi:Fur family zinc uptake transcriptional regulator|uniref:Fur family transcriptional regulator n=1 Tax=Agarivorans sp. Alg241-V36 TaxID=2305992 RepID=UPI0013D28148|nr:Fur family transcriptional regulator [Agarivorans sp. Alg241-V36]